ncbi:SDR family oxidoreductase [Nonomuraea sp. PA05]|uniref:SDR family oxidoreductase n=1 Tax=Nonomuraea sp. PA05 TaxID=2604466 RepID=UPI0011D87D97|nr:SDR family oxidoreductase [Nonomuraea sp. PA05]TYB63357.1 SDR family oxidoreductase [Nonomuraea sp. PA05]
MIVVITGANKGIGYATARVLGRAGHTVYLGARDEERGTKAAAELTAQGLDARHVRLDVTDPDTAEAAAARVEREHGHLDLLINNAAISLDHHHKPSELPVAALREVYETNVLGVVTVTNAMLPLLRRSSAGRIANVSSGLGTAAFLSDPDPALRGYATLLGYNSSKAALNAVTLMYAEELRDTSVRVSAVSPGFCATDLNGHRGVLTADEGGAHVARLATLPDFPTGAFLSERGGTYPW